MKEEIWKDNKDRYFELNPIESVRAKIVWAAIGAVVALGIMYLLS